LARNIENASNSDKIAGDTASSRQLWSTSSAAASGSRPAPSFPFLGIAAGLFLVVVPLLIVITSGSHGPWQKWLGFVLCAGGAVFVYMAMGDPAFVDRVDKRLLRGWATRAMAAGSIGALSIAIGYAILTGVTVAPWRWAVLIVVVTGTVVLFGIGRDRAEPLMTDGLAILLVWMPVEFKLLPDLVVPPFGHRGINLVKLLMAPFLIWCALFIRRWPDLGYNLYLKLRDVKIALIAFAAFTVIGLPLALIVNFVRPSTHLPPVVEIIGRVIAAWAFVALPEELLFRGLIQNGLAKAFHRPLIGLILGSVLFGAAHLDNPPKIWRYAMLATLAGVAYGWAYMKTRSSVASSIVHTLVDWVWGVFFRG
jgi:membrane protease YdiL (CAAX protease family)